MGIGAIAQVLMQLPQIGMGLWATAESAQQRKRFMAAMDPEKFQSRGWLTGNQETTRVNTGAKEFLGGNDMSSPYGGLLSKAGYSGKGYGGLLGSK